VDNSKDLTSKLSLGLSARANLMIEYAILIAIILAAFLGIGVYFKRGISGRWRATADTVGHGRQYQYEDLKGLNP
jgi:Flp pilus assembly pilin Flp